MTNNRRIILRHTAGSYPGLRQIVGLWEAETELPDRLAPFWVVMEGVPVRQCRGMRLASTDRYVLFQEWPLEGAGEGLA